MVTTTYPLIPKTTAHLRPGQFWSIPLADGRFGCGRVLRVDLDRPTAGRTGFIGAVLDWVGDARPTSESIAGSSVLAVGNAHVRLISFAGGAILGERPLPADGLEAPAAVTTYWGDGYAVARAERRFIAGDPPPTSDFRQVSSPLTAEMLRPSLTGRGVVQFNSRLTDGDFAQLGEWFRSYPETTLRAYGSYDRSITDLEFLRFFPTLRRFAADALWDSLTSLDGVRHLPPDVVELGIGTTKVPLDLAVLARFGDLQWLFLEAQTKHLEVISGFRALYDLTLRSITMPDLSLLVPLKTLRSLDVKLGGTRDLALLPRVGELWYLELWMIRGLTDVSAVGRIPSLRSLFLQALRQVEVLSDFSRATSLRRVRLETMKGLRDLSPLATAPALEGVELIDMRHLQPADLAPLAGLPNLKEVTPGLGSRRKNEAAAALLGLPPVRTPFDWAADDAADPVGDR
jgi:internalin A